MLFSNSASINATSPQVSLDSNSSSLMPEPIPTFAYSPPTKILTDDAVNILQLTDLHLYVDTDTETAGINNHNSFVACLTQALSEDIRCDLILLTGDLVNEVSTVIYDRIFQILRGTGIPFACIAGNHDVTDEIVSDSSHSHKQYIAHKPDPRLLSRYSITANNWRILLLDSSVPGKVYGRVGSTNLRWLDDTLSSSHHPVIIAMHHHVLPINSAWMDNHITKDADSFWQVIRKYRSVKAIVNGHVHQYCEKQHHGKTLYATPSTCYQFLPNSDKFALDKRASPGYRWLSLHRDGYLHSVVKRL